MNIQSINNVNFNAKVRTSHVLELTTLYMFEPDGFMGVVKTMKELYDIPSATGSKGYIHYAKLVGNKILEKYAYIADITNALKEYKASRPFITPEQMREKVSSYTEKIGENIEITI